MEASLFSSENQFCVCKASGFSLTFHHHFFSRRASLATHRLKLALAYFETAPGDVFPVIERGIWSLCEEIAPIGPLRGTTIRPSSVCSGLIGWPEPQPGSLVWAQAWFPGPVPRTRAAWASQKNKGWD